MSEAPKEIWCSTGLYYEYKTDWSEGEWHARPDFSCVKYVRADRIEELESSIKELFALLDITEETDDGRTFRPNTIRSCRALDAEKLNQVLYKMKKWV
jgi:hypothetical protein